MGLIQRRDIKSKTALGFAPALVAQRGDFVAEAHQRSFDVMPVGVIVARDFLIVSLRYFPTISADEHLKRPHFAGTNQRLLEHGFDRHCCCSDVAQAFRPARRAASGSPEGLRSERGGEAQYLSRVRGCGQLPKGALRGVYTTLTGEMRERSRRPARNTTRPGCGRTCRASTRSRFADRSTTG